MLTDLEPLEGFSGMNSDFEGQVAVGALVVLSSQLHVVPSPSPCNSLFFVGDT